MLTLAILGILVVGFFIGLKRGFAKQVVVTFGFFIAFLAARTFYAPVADALGSFLTYPSNAVTDSIASIFGEVNLENAFLNACAFVLIFVSVKVLLTIFSKVLSGVAKLPVLNGFNRILGAILGVVDYYILLFFALSFLMLVPSESTQTAISKSWFAQFIIFETPILSKIIENLWF